MLRIAQVLGRNGSWEPDSPERERFPGENNSWEEMVPGRIIPKRKRSWKRVIPGKRWFLEENNSWEK